MSIIKFVAWFDEIYICYMKSLSQTFLWKIMNSCNIYYNNNIFIFVQCRYLNIILIFCYADNKLSAKSSLHTCMYLYQNWILIQFSWWIWMQAASSPGISKLRFTIIESFDPRQSHIKSVSITLVHLARAAVNSQAISWYVNRTISTSCQHVPQFHAAFQY